MGERFEIEERLVAILDGMMVGHLSQLLYYLQYPFQNEEGSIDDAMAVYADCVKKVDELVIALK